MTPHHPTPPHPERYTTRATLVVAVIVMACVWPATTSNIDPSAAGPDAMPATAHSRSFYVARWGRDRYHGTNPRYPWRTVRRVNRARLRAGDRVLFRAGERFGDDTLMPGHGMLVSGSPRAPISFGTWGRGRATLPRGIWLGHDARHPYGPSHLVFKRLALGPAVGFQGTGTDIALLDLKITNIVGPHRLGETGIEAQGSHWLIAGNHIDRTGDSGMLLGFDVSVPGQPAGGDDYRVLDNTIEHTGLDPAITFGTHGIYSKVTNITIARNRIVGFRNDGVSVRYHGARVIDNDIAHGSIGIAWFQYDTTGGTTQFVGNTIDDTRAAAIFVCGVESRCALPLETFVIRHNRLRHMHGVLMNLAPSSGNYVMHNNR